MSSRSSAGGQTSSAGTVRLRLGPPSSARSGVTSTPSSTSAAYNYDDFLDLPNTPIPNFFSRFNFRKLRSRICGRKKYDRDEKKGSLSSAPQLKDIKLSVLKEWEKSFSALLKDPDGLELFEGFLMSEFSEENIQFWKACERYKSMPDDLVEKEATQVYEEYIAPEAPRPVNIDYETKREVLENMRIPNRSSFSGAQHSIYVLMNLDGYTRFIKSHDFQEALTRKNRITRSKSMWA